MMHADLKYVNPVTFLKFFRLFFERDLKTSIINRN